MGHKYQIYLISDSTGETLDRIFLALKSQFENFNYDKKEFVFVRTEKQIDKCTKKDVTKTIKRLLKNNKVSSNINFITKKTKNKVRRKGGGKTRRRKIGGG